MARDTSHGAGWINPQSCLVIQPTVPSNAYSMKTLLLLIASLLVATNWVFADENPNLDDPKVLEKILKEAVLQERLEKRGTDGEELTYQAGQQTPYTGWRKRIHDNGQVAILGHFKDGKPEGLWTAWHENGQKELEFTYKEGKHDGRWTTWHENGQKAEEGTCKNGKKEGLVTEWDKDGKVTKQTRYKDGKEVKE